jgi:uncharacterized membrane protein YbjE (DUF340 family)
MTSERVAGCVLIGVCCGVAIDSLVQSVPATVVLCLLFLVLMDIRERTHR